MVRSEAKTVKQYLDELPADLPLEAIGRILASTSPEKMIERYEAARGKRT